MAMPNPLPARHAPACRHCAAPLGALRAMLRDVCERPACLQHETQAQRARERAAIDAGLRRDLPPDAVAASGSVVPVVWLKTHATRLAPLPADVRDEQVRHLRAAALEAATGTADAAPVDDAGTPAARATVQACTWCQGRCCRFGGKHHAFIEPAHLLRWQSQHPGSTLDDAARAYIERLPGQHVDGSCAYHGAAGCTLDRAMRSSTCNRHRCDALDEVVELTRDDPGRGLVLVMGRREVDAAVLADERGLRALRPDRR